MHVTNVPNRSASLIPFRRQAQNRLWLVAVVAGLIATVVDRLVAMIATPVVNAPVDYPSFSWFPLFVGCMGGALGAWFVFRALKRANQPLRTFYRISAGVLLASYTLPIFPLVIPMGRFAGVNFGIALTLMLIHTITARLIVSLLTIYGT